MKSHSRAMSATNSPSRHIHDKPTSLVSQAAEYGAAKIVKAPQHSFALAVFAGAFIALAFVFYITVTTGAGSLSWGVTRLIGGIAFSLGLILVVIAGGELFTSTVLSAIAWANGKVSGKALLRCWLRVYSGNFLGASIILLLVAGAGMANLAHGAWGLNALAIAQHKLEHTWLQAFTLGVLCNLLVCLGIWMTLSCKDSLSKALILILPVAMFVSSGFEHSIANLFMVPLGISIQTFAPEAWWQSVGMQQAQFAELTISNFIFHNLIPVTLGNIVGGACLVGFGYRLTEAPSSHQAGQLYPVATSMNALSAQTSEALATIHAEPVLNNENQYLTTSTSLTQGTNTMIKSTIASLTVKDVMNTQLITLTPAMNVYQALELLSDNSMRSAAVVDDEQRLLGFISEQDCLRGLWSEEYNANLTLTVADLMQSDMLTLTPEDDLDQVIELMSVDKNTLFPVNSSGMYMGQGYQSYEQRLRVAKAVKPSVYPVIKQGRLCGLLRREDISRHLVQLFRPEPITEVIDNPERTPTAA